MRAPVTPISTAEATLAAIRSVWARTLIFFGTVWIALVLAQWVADPYWLDLTAGNPLGWFIYQCRSCAELWGLVFLVIHAAVFYTWIFTDSFRVMSLVCAFGFNFVQVLLMEKLDDWLNNWHVLGFLVVILGSAVLITWLCIRSKWTRKRAVPNNSVESIGATSDESSH